jgi:hypothetical protein
MMSWQSRSAPDALRIVKGGPVHAENSVLQTDVKTDMESIQILKFLSHIN